MTTITVDRELLEQTLDLIAGEYQSLHKAYKVLTGLRIALAAPVTAPDEVEQLRKDAERKPMTDKDIAGAIVRSPAPTSKYLKDGETPAERIKREIRDTDAALTLLIREKKRTKELEDLLRSACAIAERQGAGTSWVRFISSVHDLGLTGVTARTYRVLRDEVQEQAHPPQEDASLAATTKALTFAKTALLVVNSGASQQAISLIDEALNQSPTYAKEESHIKGN